MRESLKAYILVFVCLLSFQSPLVFAEDAPEAEYQPGEVLVQVEPQTPPEEVERIAASVGARLNRPIVPGELYLLSFDEDLPVFEIIEQLEIHPAVQYAEPNYLLEAFLHTAGDPNFSSTGGGAPVVVAVIDTGIDLAHPAFTGHLYVNSQEIAGDGIDNDGNGYTDDVNGYDFYSRDADPTGRAGNGAHGTQVSGRVLAGAVDAQVQLMALRVGPGPRIDLAASIEAIRYAADNGARVINMSFGSSFPSTFLRQAVEYAAGRGALLVAAAGNNGWSLPSYPAAFANVVSVASSNASGVKSVFSNYGPTVDFTAIGEQVTTTTWGGATAVVDGTSFSAPFVAGVAARILAAAPNLTVQQVLERLRSAAADVNALNPGNRGLLGAGLVTDETARRLADAFPLTPGNPPAEDPPGDDLEGRLEQARQEVARLEAALASAQSQLDTATGQKSAAEAEMRAVADQRTYAWGQLIQAWRARLDGIKRKAPPAEQARLDQEYRNAWDTVRQAMAKRLEAEQKLMVANSELKRAQERYKDVSNQLAAARDLVADLERRLEGGTSTAALKRSSSQRQVESALRGLQRVRELLEESPVPEGFGEVPALSFPEAPSLNQELSSR
ncbi:MAG: S8 family serine peptidase [Candidatus Omnitrophica bacterium]|nr:S8 family serine peptidase [Candidatus Omnitrophota bacterium]